MVWSVPEKEARMKIGTDATLHHNGKVIRIVFRSLEDGMKGTACTNGSHYYLIAVNTNQSAQSQRFTVGHELAHILNGHFFRSVDVLGAMEAEANRQAWKYYGLFRDDKLDSDAL